jgi:hypothetical protein
LSVRIRASELSRDRRARRSVGVDVCERRTVHLETLFRAFSPARILPFARPSSWQLRRVIVGHHGVDDRAVLATVQASVLRTDRSAAAGLDRVCAQRTSEAFT